VHDAVAMVYRVEKGLLKRPTRGRSRVAFARQVAMYLAHVTFGLTLTMVGRAFGRDRTTVSHACALVEDARDNPEFDRTLEVLESIARRLASLDNARLGHPAE
jgi:chromosomal replication initiation ATPase DnaA